MQEMAKAGEQTAPPACAAPPASTRQPDTAAAPSRRGTQSRHRQVPTDSVRTVVRQAHWAYLPPCPATCCAATHSHASGPCRTTQPALAAMLSLVRAA